MCGPNSIRSHLETGLPSSNTSPDVWGQIPNNTRAKVDLPEPEAPNTTVQVPLGIRAVTPLMMGVSRPGAEATTSLTTISPCGISPTSASSRMGCASNKLRKRTKASRAVKNPPQVDTIKSMGANARVMRTLAAIMAPGDNSPRMTSKAPPPRAKDCCV